MKTVPGEEEEKEVKTLSIKHFTIKELLRSIASKSARSDHTRSICLCGKAAVLRQHIPANSILERLRVTQAISLKSPSHYTPATFIHTSKGLNTLLCKEKRENKNQTLATKSIAASSSKSARGGEEMALLLVVIDMQRQFGESPLQLMKPKEPRWAWMAITQLNTVLNFLRNLVISRSALSSVNYHTLCMYICSCFLLKYNYRLSIKCRGFSTVWNGIFSQQTCQRNAAIHWNLNIDWGNMFSLKVYVFSTWSSLIHLLLVSLFVRLIQTHLSHWWDGERKGKIVCFGTDGWGIIQKKQIDLGKHQSHHSELNITEFTGKYLFQEFHIHYRYA